ncbi:MAG: carbohydrate-binding protein [Fibrobacteres bacterium]|nr:carbohydrate-binding protein [Fibrobacterota bacterium]
MHPFSPRLPPANAIGPVRAAFGKALLTLVLAASTALDSGAAITASGFVESKVASGFDRPTQMEASPDGRLFILQQGGAIRIFKNNALLTAPFMTLANVFSTQDYGLLGIAFDPAFPSNNFVYLYYAVAGNPTYTRISRVTAAGDLVQAGSEVLLFQLDNFTGTTHQGGALHFGKDGKLYVFTGTPNSNLDDAQNLSSTYGKVLRINSDGTIPSDNPWFNVSAGRYRAIYARGLRNPFTSAVQSTGGRIFINDNGQDSWEEINELQSGANYGWPAMEGNTGTPPAGNKAPFYAYSHLGPTGNSGSIVAAAFYNPAVANFPSPYIGKYFYADHVLGEIRYLDPDAANPSPATFATGLDHPLDIKVAGDGRLYYLVRGNGSDPNLTGLYRVQYATNLAPAITQHPASVTVSLGEAAMFCASAAGSAPLSYQWQRNGINVSGATGSCHTTPSTALSDNGAQYRVIASNPWGAATSNPATLSVTADRRPTATIISPAAGARYNAGDAINYSGSSTDPEEGSLAASAFTWWINFHHNTHAHTSLPQTSGSISGSLATSVDDEKSDNVWYRVHLRVTDAQGLSDDDSVDVLPNKTTLTLATNPAGIGLSLDGAAVATPLSFPSVTGIRWNLAAPASASLGSVSYTFSSWSDGLAASHDIFAPAANTAFTANYVVANPKGTILRQAWNGLTGNTVASLTGNAGYPGSPSATSALTSFEGPTDVGDDYGSRIVGLLYPPASGSYTFWIAGDDNVELWLGTGALSTTRVRIAYHNDWTTPRQWTKVATQQSAAISLTAGQKYWIEAIHKESTGGDNLAVAWQGPGIAQQVIPGAYLSQPDPVTGLPAPWADADIGGPALAGGASHSGGAFTVKGGGADIWGAADAFHFVYQNLNGDGEIKAKVLSVSNTDPYAKAGVMMREGLAANARNVLASIAYSTGSAFQLRSAVGGATTNAVNSGIAAPYWVRLVRSGNTFTAYRSADGQTWALQGQATLAMASQLQVGMAVTAHNNALLNTSVLSNVTVTAGIAFSEAEIGSLGVAGGHTVNAGSHTLRGSGADIWGAADAFHFTYSTMQGDGEIRARVAAVQNTNGWAKAGVMMREGVGAGARNVMMAVSANQGTIFQRRLTAGGSSIGNGTTGLLPPYWVRLVRAGNVFSAYRSPDGVTWTLAGQETLALSSSLQVGLAACSHDNALLGSATFDNLTVP